MKKYLQILCLCCFLSPLMYGQFTDSFDDGDFTTNPTWQGDIENFKVNEIFQLALDAAEAGTSNLFTSYDLSADFTWEIDIVMDFSPSANNKLACYFFIDNQDPGLANGYFLEIGENLSEDNLKFFRISDGIPDTEPLAEGELGALAVKPAVLSVRIERIEGLWSVYTSYVIDEIPTLELSFFDETYDFVTEGFWVLNPKYTSSNTTNFTFDNISAKEYEPDANAPQLTSGQVISTNMLELVFDEALETAGVSNASFGLDPNIAINSFEFIGTSANKIQLTYAENFSSGINYQLAINDIVDISGNAAPELTYTFSVSEKPIAGDLVINEILFDPLVNGKDFVELLNVSDKLLNLEGMQISNTDKVNNISTIEGEITLEPGEIIAFSEDILSTIEDYQPVDFRLQENDLPSFNQDMGNVTLFTEAGELIDSFNYTEDMHISLLSNTKGVSLERVFAESASVEANFTSGVKSTNFATPGYENANSRDGSATFDGVLNVENDVFSPNGDGDEDQLIITLNFPDNSYLATIDIYNINGQRIKSLINNQVTAPMDIVRWDGTLDDGGKAYVGHYIVVLKAFRTDGETLYDKKHIKLLDFF